MITYQIKIDNCNSIDRGEITLYKGKLNIKYGPNGLGKSTIAKAIVSSINGNSEALKNLKPFKYRAFDYQNNPYVMGVNDIKSALIFNDTYVNQFLFQPDDVLKNSFEILINTQEFKKGMEEIDKLFAEIKSYFDDNEEIKLTILNLREIQNAIVLTKAGNQAKFSKFYKAFGSGNKIENIPIHLKAYEDFIKSDQPVNWISWHAEGKDFMDLSNNCPYCASDLDNLDKKEIIKQVDEEYKSKDIEHLKNLQEIIKRLNLYFKKDCREELEKITKGKLGFTPEDCEFLLSLRNEVSALIDKLENLRTISFFTLRNARNIDEEIKKLKIVLDEFSFLNSDKTSSIVDDINQRLEYLVNNIGIIKGRINIQNQNIKRSIVDNQKSINNFLKSAGYRYEVQISQDENSCKMRLIHFDYEKPIEAPEHHLSYGEKNAFALVLFMYQVLSENIELAVLDDPVSSFDKTKKFAILYTLFHGQSSLFHTTVLMLTHDIEPIIDIVRVMNGKFPDAVACFLTSRKGIVSEKKILKDDIQTFAQICKANIQNIQIEDIIKCIYLRRHYEIIDNKGIEYNYLASLLHGREIPTFGKKEPMNDYEITLAKSSIQEMIPHFDYIAIIRKTKNHLLMKESYNNAKAGYEKLQLFRLYKEIHISEQSSKDPILEKFVNETFHIENEYIMQLNPHEFNNVPEYVINICNDKINQH